METQMTPPLPGSDMVPSMHDWSLPYRRLAMRAALRVGVDRSFQTRVTELSTSTFAAEAVSRLHPGTRCWLTLPGLAAKQAEVLGWQGSIVTCRFTEDLSPLILDTLIEKAGHPTNH